jgi:hypothetical protein
VERVPGEAEYLVAAILVRKRKGGEEEEPCTRCVAKFDHTKN